MFEGKKAALPPQKSVEMKIFVGEMGKNEKKKKIKNLLGVLSADMVNIKIIPVAKRIFFVKSIFMKKTPQ